jgi:sugar phosphate isomerase/epimerase
VTKDRDARIGAAADTGHWMTSGVNPIEGLKTLQGRIISVHLKDRNVLGASGQHDVPFGSGVGNMSGVLDELKRQGFAGNIAIEYEYNWKNSVVDVAQCIGFFRGYAAGKH